MYPIFAGPGQFKVESYCSKIYEDSYCPDPEIKFFEN